MKFVIECVSKSSGRCGQLMQIETGRRFRTPLLVQNTKGGSIPYLSHEVFEYITTEIPALQLSLSTIDHMIDSIKLFNGSLGAYVGYPECISLLMVRDPCELTPSGHNDKNTVPLFTRRGKEALNAKRYMDVVESLTPDIYQGLCDADTNVESSKKRLIKSVQRTTEFMDICYERHKNSDILKKCTLFVPIVGGFSTFARSDSIRHAKAKGEKEAGGYIFEGFHNYGVSATEINATQLLTVMAHCLKELPADKPKMLPGGYTPPVVLELISLGVDIFDTSYAYCATSKFKALTFSFKITDANSTVMDAFLDITNDCLKEDFTPVLASCTCLTCKKHTRAYLYHLYKTKELLGPILVMIHNLHHLMEFFKVIHKCIAEDKLPELIQHIKLQGRDTAIDYSIKANDKISTSYQVKGFTILKHDNH